MKMAKNLDQMRVALGGSVCQCLIWSMSKKVEQTSESISSGSIGRFFRRPCSLLGGPLVAAFTFLAGAFLARFAGGLRSGKMAIDNKEDRQWAVNVQKRRIYTGLNRAFASHSCGTHLLHLWYPTY